MCSLREGRRGQEADFVTLERVDEQGGSYNE